MTTKKLTILLLALLTPFLNLTAKEWDDALYKQIEQSIQTPQISGKNYDITKFGAKVSNTAAQNQEAIQKAIDKCSKKGGGIVIVPAGMTFQTGAIRLKSHVNLHIEEGAVLHFAFEPELYPIVETSWEGLECFNLSPCVYAFEATDIAVTGKGTIDGGGSRETWWAWCGNQRFGWREGMVSQKIEARPRLLRNGEDGVPMYQEDGTRSPERTFGPKDGLRPQLVNFNKCQRILLEDITLLNSPFWVLHPLQSTDITVRRVKMINDGPNGDGCDPESCDRVLIEDCFFNTGDDCIAIKSGRNRDGRERAMASKNIIIRNCQMKNGHGGVVIGSEISGGCQNVFAHNCEMDSPQLERVVRIKTNSCRGGIIENINVRDIKVGTCKEAIVRINLDYEHNEICCRGNYPIVRNVNIENVTSAQSKLGVLIIGLEEDAYVYDINLKNCHFNGVAEGNRITGKTRDINYENLFINGSLTLTEKPYQHYSQWMTYSEMQRSPKSYLLDFSQRPKWSYVMGIELESMLDTYLKYGDQKILDYCQLYTDTMINPQGEIRGYKQEDYNLDNIRTGHFVTRMYQQRPEEKNLKAMQLLMKQLQDQPRTVADQVYWHKAIYAYQVWLDGIFMGLPFRCLTAPITTSQKEQKRGALTKIYDDAVDQLVTTYNRTLDSKTGLNRHAYDENRNMFWADKETGLSQHCWGRAQGWFSMALIEVLDALPADYARRQEVIDLLQKDLEAVVRWQDRESGVWYQVMDQPGREGNYLESTCSSMFAYVLLKAYRKGYVGTKYREAGIRAYRGIINRFIRVNADKTISLTHCCSVAGLGPGISDEVEAALKKINPKAKAKENRRRDGSYQYYLSEKIRDNDAKGVGPFIWASLEMEQLGFNTNNTNTRIDRQAVLLRNNPIITKADPLASLSVGNGHFATTVDITGMQSFFEEYAKGVPLTSMSDWGWHRFVNTENLQRSESEKTVDLGHGHPEVYAVEYRKDDGERRNMATKYFRESPHRLNLGVIGLELKDANGTVLGMNSLTDIRQEQKLYDGTIESSFKADGQSVEVTTAALQNKDGVLYRIKTPLLKSGKATVAIRFPYPTGKHADAASDWSKPEQHSSRIVSQTGQSAVIEHILDDTHYFLSLRWQGEAKLQECDRHHFELSTTQDMLAFEACYSEKRRPAKEALVYDQEQKGIIRAWNRWWQEGAIVDFSQCTDPRAKELERRVVLSQYLTQINCANSIPPQETGLTYNSWFGRPHLEMTWWHMVHFALWGRPHIVENVLEWYNDVAYPEAKKIAERQGFKGIRWMKMTDPWAGEAPSSIGSFLIWQQPHYIYMAEEMYRAQAAKENISGELTKKVLEKYGKIVEETAEFMADFVTYDKKTGKYILKGATGMQESLRYRLSYNQPFELAYWYYGLDLAQQWRERQGKARNEQWDHILAHLSTLPTDKKGTQATRYVAALELPGSGVSKEEFFKRSHDDHPAVLGAVGMLPRVPLYNDELMVKTLNYYPSNWEPNSTWGWDYGMAAMAAARLGQPERALQELLSKDQKNTYLPNGHNFQTADRLRIYLPGNGALLAAIAMMCAGWDGCQQPWNPGFPQDGKWNVQWEGLERMQ